MRPGDLPDLASRRLIEVRVHRWAGAVSGHPGGFYPRDARLAHQPEPLEHPGLLVVGDYLFDSTLNGVLRSANIAVELLHDAVSRHRSNARPPAASTQHPTLQPHFG